MSFLSFISHPFDAILIFMQKLYMNKPPHAAALASVPSIYSLWIVEKHLPGDAMHSENVQFWTIAFQKNINLYLWVNNWEKSKQKVAVDPILVLMIWRRNNHTARDRDPISCFPIGLFLGRANIRMLYVALYCNLIRSSIVILQIFDWWAADPWPRSQQCE